MPRVPRDGVGLLKLSSQVGRVYTHNLCSVPSYTQQTPPPLEEPLLVSSFTLPGSLNVLSHLPRLKEKGGDLEEGQEERIVKSLRFSRLTTVWDWRPRQGKKRGLQLRL